MILALYILWSPGYRPQMEPLSGKYPAIKKGAVISAVFCLVTGALHVSGQSSARQRTASTAGVTARGRRLPIISFDGTARIYR